MFSILITFIFSMTIAASDNSDKKNDNIADIVVKDMEGKEVKLADYKGKVLLIVNVASKCGNTPQYEGLEAVYKKYKSKGFEILGFPCNDFGGQEPGTNEEIKQFCSANYNVTFKLFDKIKVLGEDKSPLYAKLIKNSVTEAGDVKWNFEKFLIDKDGNIVSRFKSKVQPESADIIKAIEKELAK
ncbi:MAG: glutathione peroxidase [Ignavibacteriae bacterium HGW-Ignavibacteriae-3]|nr:MAG: glutathione peroxidase [Ignavibacteriae bacterium HGW-Ignavibacteriae-3]